MFNEKGEEESLIPQNSSEKSYTENVREVLVYKTNGEVIWPWGAQFNMNLQGCDFSGDWFWIKPNTSYTASLTFLDDSTEFSVEGEGKLECVGNGDPTCIESYQAGERSAFHGLCLLVVRSTTNSGEIKIIAQSSGIEEAAIKIRTLGSTKL